MQKTQSGEKQPLMERFQIIHGDSYQVPPASDVALVLTDPPYGTTNLDWDKNTDIQRLWTLLASYDAPVVSFGDFKLISALAHVSGCFNYEMVWEKRRPVGFLDAKRRPLRLHELIGVFGRPEYNIQKRPRHEDDYHPGKTRRLNRQNRVYAKDVRESRWEDDGTRYCGDVLHATYGEHDISRTKGMHPTAKPVNLLRLLIRMYSKPGDLICDPFMGSGSTGVASLLEGRRFIGIEQDQHWTEIAQQRLAETQAQPTLEGIETETMIDLSRFTSARKTH